MGIILDSQAYAGTYILKLYEGYVGFNEKRDKPLIWTGYPSFKINKLPPGTFTFKIK